MFDIFVFSLLVVLLLSERFLDAMTAFMLEIIMNILFLLNMRSWPSLRFSRTVVESVVELISMVDVGVRVEVLPNTCTRTDLMGPNSGTVSTVGARSGGAKSGDAKSCGAKSGGAKSSLKISQPRRLERVLAADDSKLSREILQRLEHHVSIYKVNRTYILKPVL